MQPPCKSPGSSALAPQRYPCRSSSRRHKSPGTPPASHSPQWSTPLQGHRTHTKIAGRNQCICWRIALLVSLTLASFSSTCIRPPDPERSHSMKSHFWRYRRSSRGRSVGCCDLHTVLPVWCGVPQPTKDCVSAALETGWRWGFGAGSAGAEAHE